MPASGPISGWYPDPNGSGGQRYWDGTAWTSNVALPPQAKRGPGDYWRNLSANVRTLVISGIVAALVVIVAIAIALSPRPSPTGDGTEDPSSARSTSAPADWISSVCRRGTYHLSGGNKLPNATSSSWCQSSQGGTGISFFTYSSTFLMKNDLHFGAGSYATLTDSSGMVWLVRSFAAKSSVLAPLTQFGFDVHDM